MLEGNFLIFLQWNKADKFILLFPKCSRIFFFSIIFLSPRLISKNKLINRNLMKFHKFNTCRVRPCPWMIPRHMQQILPNFFQFIMFLLRQLNGSHDTILQADIIQFFLQIHFFLIHLEFLPLEFRLFYGLAFILEIMPWWLYVFKFLQKLAFGRKNSLF